MTTPLEDLTLARIQIRQLLEEWVFCRDNGEWDALRAMFSPDGAMTTNYGRFTVDEFLEFVQGMRRDGRLSQHLIGPSRIRVEGRRALAETEGMLLMRATVHDVAIDVTALVHYVDRIVLEDGRWVILDRFPVYIKDWIVPVRPDARLHLDEELLAQCPPGAQHLVYLQLAVGSTPEPVPVTFATREGDAVLAAGLAWLARGE